MRIGKYHIYLKKPGSLLFPLIVTLFSASFLMQSSKIFFRPSMLLVRIVVITMVVFFLAVLREEIHITTKKIDSQKVIPKNFKLSVEIKKIWFFIISMVIYIIMIDKIGFYFATFIFTLVMMIVLGVKGKKILVILPVSLVFIIYLMFAKWLMVPLPLGIFGF